MANVICLDFDDTVICNNLTRAVFEAFATDEWREDEARYERGELSVEQLGRGFAWLDTGTHQSLVEATNFIQAIEERQGMKIACLEEIALDNGWIGVDQVSESASRMGSSSYGEYLRFLAQNRPT